MYLYMHISILFLGFHSLIIMYYINSCIRLRPSNSLTARQQENLINIFFYILVTNLLSDGISSHTGLYIPACQLMTLYTSLSVYVYRVRLRGTFGVCVYTCVCLRVCAYLLICNGLFIL